MNFYFCVAVLFVAAFLGTSADHNDNSVSEDSRSSTIGNSGLNYNAGRARGDNGQAGDHYLFEIIRGPAVNGYGQVGNDSAKNIQRRAVPWDKACQVPLELHDSEVRCTVYNDRIQCNHTCQFGHTFSEGVIERQMECYYRKNKWTPVPEFENCKPFVDCGFTMMTPGGSSCQNSFYYGPTCEIFCDPYEEKRGVVATRYWCDINGSWEPNLPYCASPGSGMDLAPPPTGRKSIYRK